MNEHSNYGCNECQSVLRKKGQNKQVASLKQWRADCIMKWYFVSEITGLFVEAILTDLLLYLNLNLFNFFPYKVRTVQD